VTRYNNHDSGWASLFASDALYLGPSGRYDGRKVILAFFEEADKPFSEIRMETSRLIEEGGMVVAEWVWRATHTSAFAMSDGTEVPATGKTVELPGLSVFMVRNGEFASERDYFDHAAFISRLGIMPGS
jgi:steroid delta-isomerase-like uncharacterized protein